MRIICYLHAIVVLEAVSGTDEWPGSPFMFQPYIPPRDFFYSLAYHPSWNILNQNPCGNSLTDRIIGGSNASLGQYPWIARLGYSIEVNELAEQEIFYRCAGALISEHHVLTVSHCIFDMYPEMFISAIVLGEYNEDTAIDCDREMCADAVQTFFPIQLIYHQDYRSDGISDDIALIKLNKPAIFTRWVRPICMPFGPLLVKNMVNELADVAGWGYYDMTVEKGSSVLKTVKIPIVDLQSCQSAFNSEVTVDERQMCGGGEEGKDSCNGDSGGPLMKVEAAGDQPKYYLIGLVSYGAWNCGESNTPAIYTRIAAYIPWILDNVLYSSYE